MSTLNELRAIDTALRDTLESCNDTMLGVPAETFKELPQRIGETISVATNNGYNTGFEAGFASGEQGGIEIGVVMGKQAAYDEFWEHLQNGGAKADYTSCFGAWTNDENFKPKHDLIVSKGKYMFAGSKITDLAGLLKQQGVTLDFSQMMTNSGMSYLFTDSEITHAPVISLLGDGNNSYIFSGATKLQSIEKVILKQSGYNYNLTNTFENCTSLTDVVFEGIAKESNVNMKWCPLSRASIESVMAALGDTASGKTLTLKKTAVEAAFTTEEWETLVASKPNWTITLST